MIKVLLFAQLQEAYGNDSFMIDARGQTVGQLKETLMKDYSLAAVMEAMVAVNEEYGADDTILKEDDVIAFIPPVSGG